MAKSYPKRPKDSADLARFVVEIATGERDNDKPTELNDAAVKRGKARAKALSPRRRRAIAKKAAAKRWRKTT